MLSLLVGVAASGTANCQATVDGGPTPSPPGASVYFVDLKNGATILPKTTIHFGLRGMAVAHAGSDKWNPGHHHLLIDTELPPLGQEIPSDFNRLHFGAGETEVEVDLPPGEHTLQLLFGDKRHIPHSPPVMSEPIRVTVAESALKRARRSTPGGPAARPQ